MEKGCVWFDCATINESIRKEGRTRIDAVPISLALPWRIKRESREKEKGGVSVKEKVVVFIKRKTGLVKPTCFKQRCLCGGS